MIFFHHFDIGYAYANNYINMGMNTIVDELEREIGPANSYEEVVSNSIGLRVFKIASIGMNIKPYTSALLLIMAQMAKGQQRGWFLILISNRIQTQFLEFINSAPSTGFELVNYRQKSTVSITEDESDPLPRTRLYGGSLKADIINLIGIFGKRTGICCYR